LDGIFSSMANWATVILDIRLSLLPFYRVTTSSEDSDQK